MESYFFRIGKLVSYCHVLCLLLIELETCFFITNNFIVGWFGMDLLCAYHSCELLLNIARYVCIDSMSLR